MKVGDKVRVVKNIDKHPERFVGIELEVMQIHTHTRRGMVSVLDPVKHGCWACLDIWDLEVVSK